jgi:dTDP-4-dehydrorhamnose reductase
VVVTGASGLLGTWLRRTAPVATQIVALTNRRTVTGTFRSVTADLRDRDAAARTIASVEPHVVVHAAYALDERSIVDATANVARATAEAGAELIFVSTDAVFSGDGRTRAEDDPPDPIWDYGRWKAQAEQAVAEASTTSTIVRLPLLASIDPDDHVVARIRSVLGGGAPMTWFDDELRQPARASEVAAAIWRITELDRGERARPWHLPGPEQLSRHEIGRRIARALDLDAERIRPEPTPAGANRPRALRLGDERARAGIGWDPSPAYDAP